MRNALKQILEATKQQIFIFLQSEDSLFKTSCLLLLSTFTFYILMHECYENEYIRRILCHNHGEVSASAIRHRIV